MEVEKGCSTTKKKNGGATLQEAERRHDAARRKNASRHCEEVELGGTMRHEEKEDWRRSTVKRLNEG
ncbi:uncharacterized protein DS421_13g425620 [Arachis hypogaea]|nr:uncharacterized protein DS421_13g425620 [Arachis hypogaea]